MKLSYYQKKKKELKLEALRFLQNRLSIAWWDAIEYENYLITQAKKYGLLKEFKRKGVIVD